MARSEILRPNRIGVCCNAEAETSGQPLRRRHPLGDVDPVFPDDQYPLLELYNLADDRREERNLADKEHDKLKELLVHLNSVEAHTDDHDWELTGEGQRILRNWQRQ